MRPTDDHTSFHPSAEWLAAFKQQATADLMKRLKAYAASRLAGVGHGVQVDMDYAEDLAAAAAHDTACGRVTWNPEKRKLELHLQNVIARRVWLDWKHARKFRRESLDASADDERSTTLDDMERVLAERYPDAESTTNTIEALHELEEHARSDPELAAYIDVRGDDLTGSELAAATGLPPEAIRRVRRRLDAIRRQLPYQVRPTQGRRGN
jgi:hypothetical protein